MRMTHDVDVYHISMHKNLYLSINIYFFLFFSIFFYFFYIDEIDKIDEVKNAIDFLAHFSGKKFFFEFVILFQ